MSPSHVLYSDLLLDIEPHVSSRAYRLCEAKEFQLFPGATAQEVACMLLMANVTKKLVTNVAEYADQVALDKFLASNLRCAEWTYRPVSLLDEVLLCTFKECVWDFFNTAGDRDCILPDDLVELFKSSDLVGPGASVGARGGDFYTKFFDSPLTGTSSILYKAYERYIAALPESWKDAEGFRSRHYGSMRVVAGNRISFVQKTDEESRTIATEPPLNMAVQKGIGNIIERRLKRVFNIDLSLQQARNRDLARMYSLSDRGVTLDLKSASDTIALRMIEWACPESVTALLKVSRSPVTSLPDGSELALNMVGTMGNGFTFPLQTALFCCVIQAAAKVVGRPDFVDQGPDGKVRKTPSPDFMPPKGDNPGTYGVNGDDIICSREIASGVVRLIELLGFEVNQTKSYVEGPFRESCGGDFFQGSPVRSVYLKTLDDPQSRYKAINRLTYWSAQQGVILAGTVGHLARYVKPYPVPPWEQDVAGIKVPWSLVKGLRRSKNLQSVLYRRWVFEPVKLKIQDCVIDVPFKGRKRRYNPSGLLLSFLHGSVVGAARKDGVVGTISIRHDAGSYRTKWGTAPNWDRTSTDEPFPDADLRRRWESAAEICLSSLFR